ncbi:MAG TPA: DNA translocase FtsK 4TM domain-containing protein [Chloroflexota bacterium]|nr:DNA translocase FtsK 4TM domain-containing protein [Chloroflexota bacterium]
MTVEGEAPLALSPDDREQEERAAPSTVPSIVLSVVFVLVLLVLVVPGGTVGTDLRALLGYGLGWASYLLPIVIGAFLTARFRAHISPPYRMSRWEMSGWLLAFAAVTTILQAIDGAPVPMWGLTRGGGLIGQLSWNALVEAFGTAGAVVVTLLAVLVAGVLLFELTIEQVWQFAAAGVRSAARGLLALIQRARVRAEPPEPVGPLASDRFPEPRLPVIPREGGEPRPVRDDLSGSGRPLRPSAWQLPPLTVLRAGSAGEPSQADLARKIRIIEETLRDFDVHARVVQVNPGPTVTQFGLEPGFRERRDRTGAVVRREKIKVSEITALQNDLALALAAPSIRIEAPVPGQQVVGIEVPNGQATLVSLRQIIESSAFQKLRSRTRLAIALGEDVSGQPVVADLAKMPHLLIAGATGTGKSVCMNAMIACLLLHATPDEVRLILVDPKRVELTTYNDVPHLLRPVVVDADKVVGVLKWVVHEMDRRYKQFEALGVRNIEGYNKLAGARAGLERLPFIVVIIDELADLMMLAPDETERLLCRLAQLARATGIHLVVATQRPSVDVITGLIKANFPTRISFAVTSQIDSRTILDTPGAEKLLGRGDMLFLPTDAAKPIRVQGVFVSDEEIEAIVAHWKQFGPPQYVEQLVNVSEAGEDDEEDDLYERAKELAREHTRLSTSLLQRRLRIGYTRAARLIDRLERDGIVGPPESGGRTREVHHEAGLGTD